MAKGHNEEKKIDEQRVRSIPCLIHVPTQYVYARVCETVRLPVAHGYIWPWAGPKKAHGRKLRPKPSQALPSGLLFKPKPSPSGKKPSKALRA